MAMSAYQICKVFRQIADNATCQSYAANGVQQDILREVGHILQDIADAIETEGDEYED